MLTHTTTLVACTTLKPAHIEGERPGWLLTRRRAARLAADKKIIDLLSSGRQVARQNDPGRS